MSPTFAGRKDRKTATLERRMGFLTLAFATLVLFLHAERVVRKLRPVPGETDAVLLLLVFTLLQSTVTLLAGALGLLRPLPLGLLALLGGVALLAFRDRPDRARWTPSLDDPAERRALAIVAVLSSFFVVKALLLDPYMGDAVVYHLPKLAVWIQEGAFVWPVGP